jgi:protease PrsW
MDMAIWTKHWLLILVFGIIIFVVANLTLTFTKDVLYFPTVMMVGAFLIPVAFTAFFYQQERKFDQGIHAGNILPTLMLCALLGGLIGTLAAGTLEHTTISSKDPLTLIWVGPIEEFAKLIVPVAIFIILRKRFRTELDGLLFGVASGMAFAALETMGYELVALVVSKGSLVALDQTIIIRGLLSPAGHAAWTGLVTAALWKGRERSGQIIFLPFIGFFIVASALHTLWDFTSFFQNALFVILAYVIIGGTSLLLLFLRLREARKAARTAVMQSAQADA